MNGGVKRWWWYNLREMSNFGVDDEGDKSDVWVRKASNELWWWRFACMWGGGKLWGWWWWWSDDDVLVREVSNCGDDEDDDDVRLCERRFCDTFSSRSLILC